jgi:hypothetical protein
MHQLEKDRERLCTVGPSDRPMSRLELVRHLDYCSEMLAVISKIAAVYLQNFNESVTLSGVNEVENLTTALSQKIWQKIIGLDQIAAPPGQAVPRASVQQ